MLSLKMDSLLNPQSSHGIMDDEKLVQLQDYGDNVSDCSSTISSINGEDEEDEEVNSSGSSSGPLHDKTSLLQQLPSKRGLSKHYNGKSQSFTSLSAVACIEDLAKPDNPYNKRLETSKSLPTNKSCSSLIAKRSSNKNNNNNNDKKRSGFILVGGGRRLILGFLGEQAATCSATTQSDKFLSTNVSFFSKK